MNKEAKWWWSNLVKQAVEPEQERCPCCYKPKDDCTGCAIWSGAPQIVPDVPRWLKPPKAIEGEKTEQGVTETAENEPERVEEPWPCECGAGVPDWYADALLFACKGNTRHSAVGSDPASATKVWNKHYGVQPKEESEEPMLYAHACKCGAGLPVIKTPYPGNKGGALIKCRNFQNGCANIVHSFDLTKAYVLWNEANEADDKPVEQAEPTWDNPGPCECGASSWSTVDILKALFYINCTKRDCHRSVSGETKEETLQAWVN